MNLKGKIILLIVGMFLFAQLILFSQSLSLLLSSEPVYDLLGRVVGFVYPFLSPEFGLIVLYQGLYLGVIGCLMIVVYDVYKKR